MTFNSLSNFSRRTASAAASPRISSTKYLEDRTTLAEVSSPLEDSIPSAYRYVLIIQLVKQSYVDI